MKLRISTSGFTLLEMILATVVFGIMSSIVISVYIQTTDISHRLQMTRYLTESAREITERIASDVRERGIDMAGLVDVTSPYVGWNTHNYSQSGGEILSINTGKKYMYGQKNTTGIVPCTDTMRGDPKTHCGIYLVEGTNYLQAFNLVDSFVPDENKKRVKVTNCKFFVSGNDNTEKKVTLLFTLSLMDRVGVQPAMLKNSDITIQTTISERGFKKY